MNNVVHFPIKDQTVKVLKSEEDRSVNFIFANGQEARYVRRTDDYFIIYVSSFGGCDQACRMCHLTQTGQTEMVPATTGEMMLQIVTVLDHYNEQVALGKEPKAKKIHINWMARGEPLLNENLLEDWDVFTITTSFLADTGCDIKELTFKISTIIPTFSPEFLQKKGFLSSGRYLAATLETVCRSKFPPEIYYSMYSMDERGFRKRWLPKAQNHLSTIGMLSYLQHVCDLRVVLHWAYIEGENDSVEEAQGIVRLIQNEGLKAKFNLVRYNPYSEAQGRESSQEVLERNFKIIESAMTEPGSRIVPRVGLDVMASCGCFIETKKE